MGLKEGFSEMIRRGEFDRPVTRRLGDKRLTLAGVQLLRFATSPLISSGEMTQDEQQQLFRELAERLTEKVPQ